MDPHILIALALAALVGVSLGLLGGGGSILTVPILTYVLGMEPRVAIASSLFIVGTTSAVSLIGHARAARVRWMTGVLFGVAGMVGAFLGGLLGGWIPEVLLMVLFAIMMLATAIAMIRGRGCGRAAAGSGAHEGGSNGAADADAANDDANHSRRIWRVLLDGLLVGLATGLVGAGGGFLVVPALNLLGGLPMAVAVGTSLLVIALKSYAGLAGYLFSVSLEWPLVLAFTGIAIGGSFVGVRIAGVVPERALRKGFGWLVLAMGVFVLAQEIPGLIAQWASA